MRVRGVEPKVRGETEPKVRGGRVTACGCSFTSAYATVPNQGSFTYSNVLHKQKTPLGRGVCCLWRRERDCPHSLWLLVHLRYATVPNQGPFTDLTSSINKRPP